MKLYHGRRSEHGYAVDVEEDGECYLLHLRHDLCNHSPSGLEWRYSGSGPAQLALALASDVLGDDDRAQNVYQRLKFKLLAGLPQEGWVLTEDRIRAAINDIEQERSRCRLKGIISVRYRRRCRLPFLSSHAILVGMSKDNIAVRLYFERPLYESARIIGYGGISPFEFWDRAKALTVEIDGKTIPFIGSPELPCTQAEVKRAVEELTKWKKREASPPVYELKPAVRRACNAH